MNQLKPTRSLRALMVGFGALAVISYALHVVFGRLGYDGYDWLSQAISDLTADDSPSRVVARWFSGLYGAFSVIALTISLTIWREHGTKTERLGVMLFTMMLFISAVGYALFPLTAAGYSGTFRDVMHMVVTVLVVALTIASLITLIIGYHKTGRVTAFRVSLGALLALMVSAVLTGLVPAAYFGVAERVSVYTVVLYMMFLVVIAYTLEVRKDAHKAN